ncbi:MAG: serine/threonine protein kinase [Polyangiaceae bacterium]|nr:serine/threonine protein kinase [Myxococcales bacterium]MCB9589250.1 serine/threonine protein kinase [Polyangiaceae bacterium]
MKPGDSIVGKYVLRRRLAQGGMGEVWSAWHCYTDRDFAIKLLLPELAEHEEALGRFFQEAQATGQLMHPSIIQVYDVGQLEDNRPFLVMELLEGESLEARLSRETVLDSLEVCLIFSQVAQALKLAHEKGIIHRDLSTANVFLAAQSYGPPVPKILDFGVSKNLGPNYDGKIRTGSGAVLGSPDYMSPEQAGGAADVDPRTDLWAIGVQMYECIAGACPFRAANYNALMLDIMTREHRPLTEAMPSVDPELASIVDLCLKKDREDRIASAGELAERLERLALSLADQLGLERPGPRRRATDRLSVTAVPPRASFLPPSRASLVPAPASRAPAAAPPASALARLGRSRVLVAAGSALGGTLLGMALTASSGEPAAAAERHTKAHTTHVTAAEGSGEGPEVTPVEEAAQQSPDLVEAMTRGLGLDKSIKTDAPAAQPKQATPTQQRSTGPRGKAKRKAARHGRVALRKNPY